MSVLIKLIKVIFSRIKFLLIIVIIVPLLFICSILAMIPYAYSRAKYGIIAERKLDKIVEEIKTTLNKFIIGEQHEKKRQGSHQDTRKSK